MPCQDPDDAYEAERLHRAARNGDIAAIERLIRAGYALDAFDDMAYTPLHYAVEAGRIDAIRFLLQQGAKINANDHAAIGETPLALAVQGEHPDVVRLLLESGADPDINGWMGLTARIRAGERHDAVGKAISELVWTFAPGK